MTITPVEYLPIYLKTRYDYVETTYIPNGYSVEPRNYASVMLNYPYHSGMDTAGKYVALPLKCMRLGSWSESTLLEAKGFEPLEGFDLSSLMVAKRSRGEAGSLGDIIEFFYEHNSNAVQDPWSEREEGYIATIEREELGFQSPVDQTHFLRWQDTEAMEAWVPYGPSTYIPWLSLVIADGEIQMYHVPGFDALRPHLRHPRIVSLGRVLVAIEYDALALALGFCGEDQYNGNQLAPT